MQTEIDEWLQIIDIQMNAFDRNDCATSVPHALYYMDGDGNGDGDDDGGGGTRPFETYLSDLVEIDANQYLYINPRTFSRRERKQTGNTLSPWTHAKWRELFDAAMNNYHDISNHGIIASTVRPITLSAGPFIGNFQRSLEPNMSMEYLKLRARIKRIIKIKNRRRCTTLNKLGAIHNSALSIG